METFGMTILPSSGAKPLFSPRPLPDVERSGSKLSRFQSGTGKDFEPQAGSGSSDSEVRYTESRNFVPRGNVAMRQRRRTANSLPAKGLFRANGVSLCVRERQPPST
jgi:hypothetical protein